MNVHLVKYMYTITIITCNKIVSANLGTRMSFVEVQ